MDMVPRGRASLPHCHLQTGQGAGLERVALKMGGCNRQGEKVTDKNKQVWGRGQVG